MQEDRFELLDSPKHNHIAPAPEVSLSPRAKNIDIRQTQMANHLTQECGLLLIGLDQRQAKVRRPYFDWQPGEACSGTNVDHMRCRTRLNSGQGKQLPRGEDGFAKMARDNFFRRPYRGEIDAVVPAQE